MPDHAPVSEPWLFVLGRPPLDEYLGFLLQAAGTDGPDLATAAARWRAAAEITDDLAISEGGSADGHAVLPLTPALAPKAAQFLAEPHISSAYLAATPTVGLVPLNALVTYQRQINLRYAEELANLVGGLTPESEELFDFCLAINQPQPPINAAQVTQNGFAFTSISTDNRFLGARLVAADQAGGMPPGGGRATSAMVLYLGYGANALHVFSVNGRWILNNGSHRAYALRARGIEWAPAVIQHLSRPDDLAALPANVLQNQQLYFAHPRPPMLGDYFNADLTERVIAPRRLREVRVQFAVDTIDTPG